jgi:SAM-dependent methyltransferase
MVDRSRSQQLTAKDLWGKALLESQKGIHDPLILHTSFGTPETVEMDIFFRDRTQLSDLEVFALDLCQGNILDIGAGAGCHSSILQEAKQCPTALEISPGACQVMRQRGVKRVIEGDIFDFSENEFQTALMMMNGLGLAGTLNRLADLLEGVFSRLTPNGQILADSSDVKYIFFDQQVSKTPYYGELSYTYEYRGEKDLAFPWLFVDIDRLTKEASKLGLVVQILFEEEDQYLARITR